MHLDLTGLTPTTPPDLASFYASMSPVAPARVVNCLKDSDPVTGLDRLLVCLRVLAIRPGIRCWDTVDLMGLDAGHLMSFLRACGLPDDSLSVELWPRMLEGRDVGIRFTESRPAGSERLNEALNIPRRLGQPVLFVVSGSYQALAFEEWQPDAED